MFSSDLDPLFIRKLHLGTADAVADGSDDSCSAGVGSLRSRCSSSSLVKLGLFCKTLKDDD